MFSPLSRAAAGGQPPAAGPSTAGTAAAWTSATYGYQLEVVTARVRAGETVTVDVDLTRATC